MVFTNGCFDLFHVGHLRLLEFAYGVRNERVGCGPLIVGVNSDMSIKRIKGSGRPIIPEKDRLEIVRSIWCVDQAFIFEEDTPIELIKALKPMIIVKGPDYVGLEEHVVGSTFAEIVTMPKYEFFEETSTTKIVDQIRGSR